MSPDEIGRIAYTAFATHDRAWMSYDSWEQLSEADRSAFRAAGVAVWNAAMEDAAEALLKASTFGFSPRKLRIKGTE